MATPVFLPVKFHGQRSLVYYSPWGCKESHMAEHTHTHAHTHTHTHTHTTLHLKKLETEGQTKPKVSRK